MIGSDKITSEICVNCICLPVCINKNHTFTAADCAFVRTIFFNAAKSIRFGEEIDVHFLGIDKSYFVNCDSCNFSIGMYVPGSKCKWHIFSYPVDELSDVNFNIMGESFLK